MTERIIATGIHGRYLVRSSASAGAPILVGFHGYGENAEIQMQRLQAIDGVEEWTAMSIQGLHRFYERRSQRVVASWMTRQDRELAIRDNIAFVGNCIDAVTSERDATPNIVFAGFSQGVAMAFRAAAHARCEVAGVIAVGGDVPPELAADDLHRFPSVLICRGRTDEWYSGAKFAEDQHRLKAASVRVEAMEFDGGHEWGEDVNRAASAFLRTCPVRSDRDSAARR